MQLYEKCVLEIIVLVSKNCRRELGLFRVASLCLKCNIAKSGGFSSNDTCHCCCPQPELFRVPDSRTGSMDVSRYYFIAVTVGQIDSVSRQQFYCRAVISTVASPQICNKQGTP